MHLLDKMAGKTVFSSMDLQSGYYQIRIDAADCHKTAFNTPYGHFEFKVLPSGVGRSTTKRVCVDKR